MINTEKAMDDMLYRKPEHPLGGMGLENAGKIDGPKDVFQLDLSTHHKRCQTEFH
jgi:hypothetical protein|tara:strand:+ start:664 stop:828 length:165 start_codon:yes stop_codon:yes gene_type:complete